MSLSIWPNLAVRRISREVAMTKAPQDFPRATRRPPHVRAPDHWTSGEPVPAPEPVTDEQQGEHADGPTRYGDWELKGIAIDF